MCSNPAAVRVFRNCGQKIVFYGSQRSRETLFWRACGTFSACVLLRMCTNPAAVRVFRNCGQKIVFYGFQRSREALFRRAFCLACARILLLFECFGTADKRLVFIDCKGHVRQFFGVRFASHVLESCCCSGVSELRTKDCFFYGFQRSRETLFWRACGTFSACVLLSMCSNPAAVRVFRNCGQKIVFYGFQRSREALFRRAFCLACARILLLFECFGTADKRLFFMDLKGHVRGSFSACVLLRMCSNPAAVRVFRNCGQKIVHSIQEQIINHSLSFIDRSPRHHNSPVGNLPVERFHSSL